MSLAAIDALIAAEKALIAALDAGDAVAIESSTTGYAAALGAIRGQGAWRATPELRGRVVEAMALADAARTRVNVLADRTRQRLGLLARATGRETRVGYRRDGRLRA